MKFDCKYKGKITVFNKSKNKVELECTNLVTNTFFEEVCKLLLDIEAGTIRALGISDSDSVEASPSLTELDGELFRKIASSRNVDGVNMILVFNIGGTEAVFNWKSIGLFSTETVGTGKMFTVNTSVDYVHQMGDALVVTYTLEKE